MCVGLNRESESECEGLECEGIEIGFGIIMTEHVIY